MLQIVKSLLLASIKVLIGSIMAVFVLAVLLSLNTGERVLGIMFNSNTTAKAIVDDVLKNIVGKLPFAGYIVDVFDSGTGFTKASGYGVFHDWIKAMILFLSTGFFYRMLAKYLARWKNMIATQTHLEVWIDWIANLELIGVTSIVTSVSALLVHDWLIAFWIKVFGNGFLSNVALFVLLLLTIVGVYFVIGTNRRARMIDALTDMMVDLGLVLCVLTYLYYTGLAYTYPELTMDANLLLSLRMVLPLLFATYGFIILLRIKKKNA